MPSRAQLLAIAEWDAWRYMAKPPRSEAELGISEQEIAAGWRSTWRSARSRRAGTANALVRGGRGGGRGGRGAAGVAVRYREGREGAALSARRALSSPRPLLAAVQCRLASKRNSRPLYKLQERSCTAQLAPDDDGRALEDPSAVVKAELRVVFDALRCARPGSALVPGPLAAAEKLIPWLTDQPTSALSSRLRHGRRRARSRRVPRGRRPCAVGRVRCTC